MVADSQKGVSSMAETSGLLPIDKAQREQLLKLYWLEKYLFEDEQGVHKKFERGEHIGEFDFYCIIYWKRNPSKAKIRKSLTELGAKPQDLLDEVRKAEEQEPLAQVKALTKFKHIGVAIASAILAVCYPQRYTVVDSYILTMLAEEGYLSDDSMTIERYLEYNELCKRLSDAWGKSLRDVDRVLWTKEWKKRVVP